ncbi:MAG: gamma-glutamyltransferase, partial [Chloroflexi bacterium]|nr:gamma-glutamyltransferase [Chloroflexota bacterium]
MVFNSRRSTVMARNGMVATSQPLASMAGLRVMMEGGNAIDAAVASAAVLNVVEPASTGLGGDVFALVWMAKDKKVVALNASGRSGAASSADELTSQGMTEISSDSAYSVTVPGAVSGWDEIVSRFGNMPLSKVLEPAIEYAAGGFPVSEIISGQWANNVHKLERFPSGGELLKDGRAPRAGEVMKMPELAETLRTIAEGGAEAFYKGKLAERIAAYVRERGGWLTAEDMASHFITLEEPISTDYRGVTVWQCPPNSQGVNTLMALNLVEGYDVKGMGFQTADTYHHLIESVRLALTDGMYHVTDS